MVVKRSQCSVKVTSSCYTVILFGILGNYLFPSHLGKHFIKVGKISAKIHEIGKIKAIFGLGMTSIYNALKMAK